MARLSHKELKRGVIAPRPAIMPRRRARGQDAWLRGNHSHACHNTGHQDFRCQKTGRPGGSFRRIIQRCLLHAQDLIRQTGAVFIPPFEDPDVIAGQGTIGMEILRQRPGQLDAVFVPIGGGGLAAGVAAYVKNLRPEIRVIGVEPGDSDAMRQSIEAGYPVMLNEVGLFADGVAVKQVGEETFALCRDLLDEIVTVDTDAICGAIKDIFEATRVVAEPAGALSLAGLTAWVERENVRDQVLAAIVSGANMNFDRLGHVVDRSEIGAQREALLAVTIPEQKAAFANCARP